MQSVIKKITSTIGHKALSLFPSSPLDPTTNVSEKEETTINWREQLLAKLPDLPRFLAQPLQTFLLLAERVARAWALFLPTLPAAKAAADFALYLTKDISIPLLMPWATEATRMTTEYLVLSATESHFVAMVSSEYAARWLFQHWTQFLWGTYLGIFLILILIFSNYIEPILLRCLGKITAYFK